MKEKDLAGGGDGVFLQHSNDVVQGVLFVGGDEFVSLIRERRVE